MNALEMNQRHIAHTEPLVVFGPFIPHINRSMHHKCTEKHNIRKISGLHHHFIQHILYEEHRITD